MLEATKRFPSPISKVSRCHRTLDSIGAHVERHSAISMALSMFLQRSNTWRTCFKHTLTPLALLNPRMMKCQHHLSIKEFLFISLIVASVDLEVQPNYMSHFLKISGVFCRKRSLDHSLAGRPPWQPRGQDLGDGAAGAGRGRELLLGAEAGPAAPGAAAASGSEPGQGDCNGYRPPLDSVQLGFT
jgi:hypothetical protein